MGPLSLVLLSVISWAIIGERLYFSQEKAKGTWTR